MALRVLTVDAGGADGALQDETVRGYLDTFARLMIVEDQPPWAPRLRSKSTLRNVSKRHFVDPSLAAASLLKFAECVDTSKCGSPALLGVIVGIGYGYQREYLIDVYPMLTDETCWFLAVDFDKESWDKDISAYLASVGND